MNGAPATFTISSGTWRDRRARGRRRSCPPSSQRSRRRSPARTCRPRATRSRRARRARSSSRTSIRAKRNQPSGPLSGVQFSQLSCSDVNQQAAAGTIGPKRAPLGLAARSGRPAALQERHGRRRRSASIADGTYTLDLDITDTDTDVDELIAVAGASGFAAPADRRANQITVDGRTLRYVDSEALASNPASAPPFASINGPHGQSRSTSPATAATPIVAGVAFGTPASGYRPDTNPAFAGHGRVRARRRGQREPLSRRCPGPTACSRRHEVTQMLKSGLEVANRARAQIRRPLGSAAQVSVAVVDTNGVVLGLVRTPDAPVFGTDVAVQKARTRGVLHESRTRQRCCRRCRPRPIRRPRPQRRRSPRT